AMTVFSGMEVHDEVTRTSIICGLLQNGHGREALALGCTKHEPVFKCGELLHAHVVRHGHKCNDFVISYLIDYYYSKCGRMDEAVVLFEACATRDTVLLNIIVSAISHNLQGEDALKLFMKMCNENAGLSEHALISIVDACGAVMVLVILMLLTYFM
ncbi:pentatricopeptide repeat-containing protein, partial [Tanacetum coccineum]